MGELEFVWVYHNEKKNGKKKRERNGGKKGETATAAAATMRTTTTTNIKCKIALNHPPAHLQNAGQLALSVGNVRRSLNELVDDTAQREQALVDVACLTRTVLYGTGAGHRGVCVCVCVCVCAIR